MTDHNEKLIEEARAWRDAGWFRVDNPTSASIITRLANALEAAEKAHTPIDDERETQHAELCGCSLPHCEFLQGWEAAWDAALRSILRRSEGPEPSRIGCNVCGEALPDGEPHVCSEPQGEPSDAQVAEIEQRVYDQHRGQIAGMAKALVRAGWDAAVEGQR